LQAATQERTISTRTTEQSPEENSELLANLNVVDPRSRILRPDVEQKQAIDALYSSLCATEQYKSFRNWDQPEGRLLCISGDAGQGKSMLLRAILQTLSSKPSKEVDPRCLSFFLDHNRPDSNNAAVAFRNLIWLLL
jgi:DNA replication protein DnaC